jgi:hypothetical protein
MKLFWAAGLAAISLSATPALSEDHPTFKEMWVQVTSDPTCSQSEYADFFLFTCDSQMTMWYFTKPNHPAFPGVIKRMITQQKDGAWVANEGGTSFASDDAQPQFKAWLAQIADLDRQAREYIEKQKSQSDGKKH